MDTKKTCAEQKLTTACEELVKLFCLCSIIRSSFSYHCLFSQSQTPLPVCGKDLYVVPEMLPKFGIQPESVTYGKLLATCSSSGV